MFNTLKTLIPLSLVCTVLVGYSYIEAQFVGPTGSPSMYNAPAPINVSGIAQEKTGWLGAGALSVFGDAEIYRSQPAFNLIDNDTGDDSWSLRSDAGTFSFLRLDDAENQVGQPVFTVSEKASDPNAVEVTFTDNVQTEGWFRSDLGLRITNESPEIRFRETGVSANNWRYKIMVNDQLYNVYANRDDNATGTIDVIDRPHLFRLFGSQSGVSGDYAQFSNEVRAQRYCNYDGSDCVDAVDLAQSGTLPTGCANGNTIRYNAGSGIWECSS